MDVTAVQAPVLAPVQADNAAVRENLSTHRELIQAVRALNKAESFGEANELTFVIDPHSRRPLLRIVNRETKEVVTQIPPDHALRLAEGLA